MISEVDGDGNGTFCCEKFLKMMIHKIWNRDPNEEIFKATAPTVGGDTAPPWGAAHSPTVGGGRPTARVCR